MMRGLSKMNSPPGAWPSSRVSSPLRLWAHDVHNPANVGGLFRLADAFDVEHIYLSGRASKPPNVKIHRNARSADRWVPYSYSAQPQPYIEELRRKQFQLVALEIASLSQDICELPRLLGSQLCWLVGSEKFGLPDDLLAACDKIFHISMFGRNSSINVTNAAAIALFASRNHPVPPRNLTYR